MLGRTVLPCVAFLKNILTLGPVNPQLRTSASHVRFTAQVKITTKEMSPGRISVPEAKARGDPAPVWQKSSPPGAADS